MTNLSLSAKTLLLALLNLVLLALVFFAFARWQYRFDLPSYLVTSAEERMASVSRQLALELPETPQHSWSSILARYSARYPAQLYLFRSDGQQLAGTSVQVPSSLLEALRKDPFVGAGRRGNVPPPPEEGQRSGPRYGGQPPPEPNGQQTGPPAFQGRGPFRREPRRATPLPLVRTDSPRRYWTGVRIPIWIEASDQPIHAAIIWEIPSFWTEPFFIDYRPWLVVLLAIIVVSALCWIPPIRGLTQAVKRLTVVTGQIANGHFDIVLPVKRRDELGNLSDSINRMAQRLSGFVYGQKRFLGDIAHELSSPIARIQVGLSIVEQRTDESTQEYLSDVREEVEHMSKLVGELLAFSKSQVTEQQAGLTPVALNEVIDRAIARETSRESTVKVSGNLGFNVLGTSECLFRAFANILRNAVRYAGNAGPINISAYPGERSVSVLIEDQGPGLPESELENVFRPFYRPEFARQRETGGTGLGLAIVRDCVESCGGTVRLRNRAPAGLQVEIRLVKA